MSLDSLISNFIDRHQLPVDFALLAKTYYLPLGDWLQQQRQHQDTLVVGINGCQGSGKSTLADFLQQFLEYQGLNVASLSIDDLYLTRAQRQQLAKTVHPLLQTRGVPGTHDTAMGIALIDQLRQLSKGEQLRLPRFDKASDDRLPKEQWPVVHGPVEVIILEGWCVGSRPQATEALHKPVNALEAESDPQGTWRQYVNEQLAGDYQALFSRLDRLVILQAPSFDCVYHWRLEQEQKLALHNQGAHIMTDDEVLHFIQFYQRLTEHNLKTLPAVSDVLFTLNAERQTTKAKYP